MKNEAVEKLEKDIARLKNELVRLATIEANYLSGDQEDDLDTTVLQLARLGAVVLINAKTNKLLSLTPEQELEDEG